VASLSFATEAPFSSSTSHQGSKDFRVFRRITLPRLIGADVCFHGDRPKTHSDGLPPFAPAHLPGAAVSSGSDLDVDGDDLQRRARAGNEVLITTILSFLFIIVGGLKHIKGCNRLKRVSKRSSFSSSKWSRLHGFLTFPSFPSSP
jgi:hypothetical protein